MQRVSAVPVLAAVAAVLSLSFLVGCGSSNTAGAPSQILLTPTSVSLNEGGVATLSAIAQDAAGNTVAADISFTSNNTSVATVSSGGLVCGGQWDSSFINCNSSGNSSGVGTVTITAAATATPSVTATTTIYVHEKVDRVGVGVSSCTTMGKAVSIYGVAYSTSAPGCSTASPCNITSTVGPFTFGSNDSSVASITTGASGLTAGIPGATTVFASVSGVNSVGVPYQTCPAAFIYVHSSTDDNVTSFTLNTGATQPIVANVYDTNGQPIAAPVIWSSSASAAATVAVGTANNLATVTAVAPGTATITATCSYPACNKLVPPQYGLNVNTVTVAGGSSTTVYAASTNSTMLVPIKTSTNEVGTAITLPFVPNSIIADPSGTNLYLGSSGGLMVVNVSTGAVSLEELLGAVLAISPNSSFLVTSSPPANAIYYFNLANQTIAFGYNGTTSTAAYTPDSNTVATFSGTTLYTGSSIAAPTATPLSYMPAGLDVSAQGGLIYLTAAGLIDVRSTCSISDVQMLMANNPTLIKTLPNGTGAVVADAPAIDLIATPSPVAMGCPVATQSSITSHDLGAGPFTAQQLILSPDGSRAWIISDLSELLSFYLPTTAPTLIPYTGGVTGLSGGVTPDGMALYIGASDGAVHRIAVSTNSDVQQIGVGLKDSSGNATPPNLVYVVP